jgi:hypothetical protein
MPFCHVIPPLCSENSRSLKKRLSSDDLNLKGLTVPSPINYVYSRETRSSIFTHFCFKLLMLYRYEFFLRVTSSASPAPYVRDSL